MRDEDEWLEGGLEYFNSSSLLGFNLSFLAFTREKQGKKGRKESKRGIHSSIILPVIFSPLFTWFSVWKKQLHFCPVVSFILFLLLLFFFFWMSRSLLILFHFLRWLPDRCKISSVGDTFLTSLTNLVELDLSWNLLESIPTEALKTAASLRRLSLNNNHRLKVIDEYSFPDLESLIFLDLNDCQLEVIDSGAFLGLKSLRTLLLSGNKLKSMPGSVIEPLSHLQELNLHGNYWSCDCSLRDLRMQMIQKNIPLSFDPSCSSPDRIKGFLWSNLNLDEFACPPSFFPGDTASFIRSQHQQTQSSQKYLSSSYSSSSSSNFVPSSSSSAADQFYVTEGMFVLLIIFVIFRKLFSVTAW